MKQAIIITAYRDLEQLRDIVDFFDDDFDFYIHIDRKCAEPLPNFCHDGVHVVRRYRITWGSERHLYAILHLLRMTCNSPHPYSYYHIITATDYPIKPLAQFKQFFSAQNTKSYLEWYELPRASWTGEGGMERIKYYWIGNSWRDQRQHPMRLMHALLKLQRKFGLDRSRHAFGCWYGGGGYCSLSHEAASKLAAFSARKVRQVARFTHCCEEVLPHTVLLNALPHSEIEPYSLHLSLWDAGAASPRPLTLADLPTIEQSPCF